jgi:hypothetical protein
MGGLNRHPSMATLPNHVTDLLGTEAVAFSPAQPVGDPALPTSMLERVKKPATTNRRTFTATLAAAIGAFSITPTTMAATSPFNARAPLNARAIEAFGAITPQRQALLLRVIAWFADVPLSELIATPAQHDAALRDDNQVARDFGMRDRNRQAE